MSIDEKEIAQRYVARFGAAAAREAQSRARALADLGDASGEAMWVEIARLVERMRG